jgi:hypothetical protein
MERGPQTKCILQTNEYEGQNHIAEFNSKHTDTYIFKFKHPVSGFVYLLSFYFQSRVTILLCYFKDSLENYFCFVFYKDFRKLFCTCYYCLQHQHGVITECELACITPLLSVPEVNTTQV